MPERYAIDFIRLDARGLAFAGDPSTLKSWPYYGTEVRAVAPGRVVENRDDMPDKVPLQGRPPAKADDYAGNHVIVAMGGGRYALYAHLMPGSVAVARGQRVGAGQTLGKLGNSGNTDAPHLHFQVMDAPSALDATGLPFVFAPFARACGPACRHARRHRRHGVLGQAAPGRCGRHRRAAPADAAHAGSGRLRCRLSNRLGSVRSFRASRVGCAREGKLWRPAGRRRGAGVAVCYADSKMRARGMSSVRKLVALFLLGWMPLQALAMPLLTWRCASHEVPAPAAEAMPCHGHDTAVAEPRSDDSPAEERSAPARGGEFCCSHFSALPAALILAAAEPVPFEAPVASVPAFSFLSRPLTQPPRG